MQYITEMTDQEILELSHEQLERMIQVKTAEEGIKLISAPAEPTYAQLPNPDVTIYKVSGLEKPVRTQEEALRLSEILKASLSSFCDDSYDSRVGYSHKYLAPAPSYFDPGEVSAVRLFSKEVFDTIRETAVENERLKEAYVAQQKEYKDAFDQASWIRDEVYDHYNEVAQKQRALESLKQKFDEYVELADGDKDQALKFMSKAYPLTAEQIKYIYPEAPELTEATS